MDLLNQAELETLIGTRQEPCVSIFLPTHRTGAEIQQDPIRLKNLLRTAEERLEESGLRGSEAEELLAPARRLMDDEPFWQHQSDGLALFLAANGFRYYRVPYPFEELVVVTERFHIKPLLRVLSGDGRFYVLAISGKQVRLLEGTRHSVAEIDLENVPQSLAEALRFDDPERQLQFHTPMRGSSAVFHGQGTGTDDAQHKKDMLRYFQLVDRGLQELFSDERAPLVLAGVDYLLPIYREANTYANLLDDGVTGNPDRLTARELHDRAWAIVEPYFAREQESAAAEFRKLLGTGRASHDLREVVPAAHHGRVDSLFVTVGVQAWGTYSADDGEVELHDDAQQGDQDLLDLAAVQTLLKGGTVYAVEKNRMPAPDSDEAAAALFRY